MADNSSLPVASGNETFANDDIGGVKYPRAKVALGADGTGVDWVGGSGANGTGVARVTIATDDTLMAAMSAKLPSALGAGGGLKVQMYNAAGSNVDPVAAGPAAKAASVPVSIATDDPFYTNWNAGEYETVAASQTAQVLGATGGTGDWLDHILVIPATTSPGNVLLLDNATSITVFTGGASSVSNLVPFSIPIRAKSASGAWKITTGSNVSAVGFGNFT